MEVIEQESKFYVDLTNRVYILISLLLVTRILSKHPYPQITLNLGDWDLMEHDNEEVMPVVTDVIIHPNYTGNRLNYSGYITDQIREYDVALLDLGPDNKTQPILNKFIKPICFPYRKYRNSKTFFIDQHSTLWLIMLVLKSVIEQNIHTSKFTCKIILEKKA